MGIRTSAIKYLHRRSNTRYKKSVVVKEHLRVKVNAEYFANQTGFCTDLYQLDDQGKKPKERLSESTKICTSSGKCVHQFSDGSKRLFAVANLMVMSETCVEKAREGGEKVQRKIMFACTVPSSCFYFSYFLAHRKYHCLFSAAQFVVQINLNLAKRGRSQGDCTKHTEACIFCLVFNYFRIF